MAADTWSGDFSPWSISPHQQAQSGNSRFPDEAFEREASDTDYVDDAAGPGYHVVPLSPTERSEDDWPDRCSELESGGRSEGCSERREDVSSPQELCDEGDALGFHFAIFSTELLGDVSLERRSDSWSAEPNKDTPSERCPVSLPTDHHENALTERFAVLRPTEHFCADKEHCCTDKEHCCTGKEHWCTDNEHCCTDNEHCCTDNEHCCTDHEHCCTDNEHCCTGKEHRCSDTSLGPRSVSLATRRHADVPSECRAAVLPSEYNSYGACASAPPHRLSLPEEYPRGISLSKSRVDSRSIGHTLSEHCNPSEPTEHHTNCSSPEPSSGLSTTRPKTVGTSSAGCHGQHPHHHQQRRQQRRQHTAVLSAEDVACSQHDFHNPHCLSSSALPRVDRQSTSRQSGVGRHSALGQGGVDRHSTSEQSGVDRHSALGQGGVDRHSTSGQSGVDRHSIPGQSGVDRHFIPGHSGVARHSALGQGGVDRQSTPGQSGVDRHSTLRQSSVDRHSTPGQSGVDRQSISGQSSVDRHSTSRQSGADRQSTPGQSGVDRHSTPGQSGVDRQSISGQSSVDRHSTSRQSGVDRQSTPGQSGVDRHSTSGQSGVDRHSTSGQSGVDPCSTSEVNRAKDEVNGLPLGQQRHCKESGQIIATDNGEEAIPFEYSTQDAGVHATIEQGQASFPFKDTDSSRTTTPSDLGRGEWENYELLPFLSSHSDRNPDLNSAPYVAGATVASGKTRLDAGGDQAALHVQTPRAAAAAIATSASARPPRRNDNSSCQPESSRRVVVAADTGAASSESNRGRGAANGKGTSRMSQRTSLNRWRPAQVGMEEDGGEEEEEETQGRPDRKAEELQQQQKPNTEGARPARRVVRKKTRRPKDKERARDKKGRGTEPSAVSDSQTKDDNRAERSAPQPDQQGAAGETDRPRSSAEDRHGAPSQQTGRDAPARPRSCPPAANCGFSGQESVQTLVRLSEDLRFFKLFNLLHAPCRGLAGARSFGPWCSRAGPRRSGSYKQPGGAGPNVTSVNASASPSFSSKTTKEASPGAVTKEKIPVDKSWQGSAAVSNGSTSNRDRSSSLNAVKEGGGSNPASSSTAAKTDKANSGVGNNAFGKPTDVFQRLSGQVSPYVFRHLADVRRYMSEYRELYTVGRVGRKLKKVAVLGVDVVDPYSNAPCRRKKSCACKECCSSSQVKRPASPPNRDGAVVPPGGPNSAPSGNDNSAADKQMLTRSVPNLAPVRESKASTSNAVRSQPVPPEPSRHTTSDPADFLPTALVLPRIQSLSEAKRLAQPATALCGPLGIDKESHSVLFRAHASCSSLDERGNIRAGRALFEGDQEERATGGGGAYSKRRRRRKGGGGAGVRLKYTTRPNAAAEKTTETTSELLLRKSSSGAGLSLSRSEAATATGTGRGRGSGSRLGAAAGAEEAAPSVSGLKLEAAGSKSETDEEPTPSSSATAASREPLLPGIVRKGLTGEQCQRQPTFHRSLYTSFTLAKKIYAGKQEQQQQPPFTLMAEDRRVLHGSGSSRFSSGEPLPSLSHRGVVPNNTRPKRSRSVDVGPDCRVRVDSWKAALNSPDAFSGRDNGSLSVKVMSVDDLPSRLSLEDGRDLCFPVLKHRRHPRLPPVKDSPSRSSGATPVGGVEEEEGDGCVAQVHGNQVTFFVPEASQSDACQKRRDRARTMGGRAERTTDEGGDGKAQDATSAPPATRAKEVNGDSVARMKSQNDFTPRPQRDVATSLSISKKNSGGDSEGAGKALVDEMGIRGKTIADGSLSEITSAASRKGVGPAKPPERETAASHTSPPDVAKSEHAAPTTPRVPQKEKIIFNPGGTRALTKENLPAAQKPGFPGKLAALRQPTILIAPVNSNGHQGSVKRETTSSSIRSAAVSQAAVTDSLRVKGGSLERENAAHDAADRKEASTGGNSHSGSEPLSALKVEYRLPKEAVPSLDKKEHVTAVR